MTARGWTMSQPAVIASLLRRDSVVVRLQGERYCDWAWIHLDDTHFVLVRRSVSDPSELGVLPLLRHRSGDPGRAGTRRRVPVEHRGDVPGHQERGRTGPLPGPAPGGLVPAHHARHGRPRPPGPARRSATGRAATRSATPGTDQPDKQPDRARTTVDSPHRGPAACGQPPGNPHPRNEPIIDSHIYAADAEELIPLTANEIRRLHALYHQPRHPWRHRLHWSRWRRRHQLRARSCHYRRRARNH